LSRSIHEALAIVEPEESEEELEIVEPEMEEPEMEKAEMEENEASASLRPLSDLLLKPLPLEIEYVEEMKQIEIFSWCISLRVHNCLRSKFSSTVSLLFNVLYIAKYVDSNGVKFMSGWEKVKGVQSKILFWYPHFWAAISLSQWFFDETKFLNIPRSK